MWGSEHLHNTFIVLSGLLNNKVVKNEFKVLKCKAQSFLPLKIPPKILGSLKGGLRQVQVVTVGADVTVPK